MITRIQPPPREPFCAAMLRSIDLPMLHYCAMQRIFAAMR
jgi:hypothetical protein